MANTVRVAVVLEAGPEGQVQEYVWTYHVKLPDSHEPVTDEQVLLCARSGAKWWGEDGPFEYFSQGIRGSRLYGEWMRLNRVEARRIQPTESEVQVWPGENAAGDGHSFSFPFGLEVRLRPHAPQVAWLIGLRTSESTRRHRGRMYWPASVFEADGDGFLWFVESPDPDEAAVGLVPVRVRDGLAVQAQNLAYWVRAIGETEGEYSLAVYSRIEERALAVLTFDIGRELRTQRSRVIEPPSHEPYGLLP